jgi:GH15 family glucan-1,4-alpha-glucosidase
MTGSPAGVRGGADAGPLPISDHGLVGDLRTAALVGTDGTVSWFCPGRFDAPSVFASVLDEERGGSWRLEPVDGSVRSQQFYFPDTAVLATRFLTDDGVLEVHDFMPIERAEDPDHRQRLVRRVVAVRGRSVVRSRVAARPHYGRTEPTLTRLDVDRGAAVELRCDARAGDPGVRLTLTSTVDLDVEGPDVVAQLTLEEGEDALFVLEAHDPDGSEAVDVGVHDDTSALFEATSQFWRSWLAQSTYAGRWRETVHRSAITLKLLTHEPSGAVVAAPTTSLPETIGGSRNWDYRYVWIRDAGFSLYALLRLGFTSEANAFTRWLSERLGEDRDDEEELGPLRVLYDIDGASPTREHELDHLSGYRDSRPVRVGNAAVDQLQLDIYGEVIDAVYLFDKYGPGISHDAWNDLRRVLDWLVTHWDDDDAGMWEIRGDVRPHTTSRLMCWVAVERMIRMARRRGLPGDVGAWSRVRDEISERIHGDHWDPHHETFLMAEHDPDADPSAPPVLDAGVLLMPMVKFCSPVDPRFLSTLDAIEEQLVADSLVFRYDVHAAPDGIDDTDTDGDGVGDGEGTFSLCSFWYVEALTRAGRLREAEVALEKMFTYANHLGLYAEQIGATGDQLGNFPQAFTHLSLISAAINLDRALG